MVLKISIGEESAAKMFAAILNSPLMIPNVIHNLPLELGGRRVLAGVFVLLQRNEITLPEDALRSGLEIEAAIERVRFDDENNLQLWMSDEGVKVKFGEYFYVIEATEIAGLSLAVKLYRLGAVINSTEEDG